MIAGRFAFLGAENTTQIMISITANTAELERALDAGVDRVLLDNFSLSDLELAVATNRAADEPAELEASGGVEFDDLAGIAATGVDFISTGALTKHLRATDFSMRFAFERKGS